MRGFLFLSNFSELIWVTSDLFGIKAIDLEKNKTININLIIQKTYSKITQPFHINKFSLLNYSIVINCTVCEDFPPSFGKKSSKNDTFLLPNPIAKLTMLQQTVHKQIARINFWKVNKVIWLKSVQKLIFWPDLIIFMRPEGMEFSYLYFIYVTIEKNCKISKK